LAMVVDQAMQAAQAGIGMAAPDIVPISREGHRLKGSALRGLRSDERRPSTDAGRGQR